MQFLDNILAWSKRDKKYVIMAIFPALVLLAFFGAQTMSVSEKPTKKEVVLPLTGTSVESSTTSVFVIEVTTTVPETTTTESTVVRTTVTTRAVPRTTTTEPYVATTLPQTVTSGSNGPPRNTTTLVGCIAFYESTWGDADSNVFQFVPGTWRAYGGTGSPENAPYWRQEEVFWLAWEDSGHHHWAAQKGRCF